MNKIDFSQAPYDDGLLWDEYLEEIPRSRSMQQKRYESVDQKRLNRFEALTIKKRVLILVEAGCGDCAWAVPQIVSLLTRAKSVEVRLFLREYYPQLQDQLLTKGKRSVPKLVILDNKDNIVGEWGPRPSAIQDYVEASVGKIDRSIWYREVLKYNKENGEEDLASELFKLLSSLV
jgi:thioredoxin family protein